MKRGGKRAKKMKKHPVTQESRELVLKEDGQDYAIVDRVLGSGRYHVRCYNQGVMRLAHKRGALTRGPNKAIIIVGDILLVSLRDYQDGKCDIIAKYSSTEVAKLTGPMGRERVVNINPAFIAMRDVTGVADDTIHGFEIKTEPVDIENI